VDEVPAFVSPTVRRRRLAAELRRLRDRAHLTGDEVASRLGWSPSKISRYELAQGGLKPAEVRRLLEIYGVDADRRDELLALAREATNKGWWEEYADAVPDEYVSLIGMEAEATAEWSWHLDMIPGLLQRESYMRAIANQAQALAPAPPSKIDRRLALRLRRQQLLYSDPPLQYSVVIDQSVLMRRVGDNSVMRGQLTHLIDAAALPNVSLRVMRLDDRSPMIVNSFDILTFGAADAATMPDVVWTEHLTTAMYFEGETDTFQYHLLFRTLVDNALDPEPSVELINQIMRQVWS
jgi:transcriptional regulator with XRE-family HTH domain